MKPRPPTEVIPISHRYHNMPGRSGPHYYMWARVNAKKKIELRYCDREYLTNKSYHGWNESFVLESVEDALDLARQLMSTASGIINSREGITSRHTAVHPENTEPTYLLRASVFEDNGTELAYHQIKAANQVHSFILGDSAAIVLARQILVAIGKARRASKG